MAANGLNRRLFAQGKANPFIAHRDRAVAGAGLSWDSVRMASSPPLFHAPIRSSRPLNGLRPWMISSTPSLNALSMVTFLVAEALDNGPTAGSGDVG